MTEIPYDKPEQLAQVPLPRAGLSAGPTLTSPHGPSLARSWRLVRTLCGLGRAPG